ncbi:MAG: GNAT family N-acetyltransferase, partial [Candidatus Aegiribacteria sp.]|nr:GNAT family N-acetyltransferase [Candidatus Aegiribacteria sp.]MBD3295246.1 GNAT family N-acetyltransferase [Candidatus Fermentibacteria bacterium]
MIHRTYDPEKDADDCHRIWREVGWVESDKHEKAMDVFLGACRVLVADLNGAVAALVNSTPGTVRYLDRDIKLSAVCGVTAGYTARKRGLAGRLTAELMALDAAEGAEVAGLGIF